MNVNLSLLRNAGLLVGAALLAGRVIAADADTLPVFETNYLKLSALGSSFTEGSKAASQRRLQLPSMGAGGIEAFAYTKEVDKQTTWQVDGKALGNAGDYLAQFKLTKNEVGSFEVGYKRFRTFYDGLGGFFPTNNNFMPIYQRANYVDRGKFYIEGQVNVPKAPVYTFRYTNETRSGTKDSTIWGETSNTGIPIYNLSALNPVPAARKIVPAYLRLNERQQTFEVSMKQTFGKTTALLSAVGTKIDNNDTRSVTRYAGEVKPFPAIPTSGAAVLIPPSLANSQNNGFDQQLVDEKGWTFTGKLETELSETMTAYAGASYHYSNGDVGNNRMIFLAVNTATGRGDYVGGFTNSNVAQTSWGRPPYSYNGTGDIKLDVYTANAGIRTKLGKDLRLDVGVKAEDYTALAKSRQTYVASKIVIETGSVTTIPVNTVSNTRNSEKVWTPALDARYTGIKNVTLFADWDYRSSPGIEKGNYGSYSVNTTTGLQSYVASPFDDKVKEKHANYKVGANWNALSAVTLRTEFFSKDHENRFDGVGVSAGDFYVLDYDIYGLKSSAIVRVSPQLTLTTRYVIQRGQTGVAHENSLGNFSTPSTGDSRRYQISETANWTPNKSLFVQADVNVVYDRVQTVYRFLTGAARDVLRNSDNNYWNGSLLTGFVVSKVTNATLQATYYKAGNYERALAATTMPYGAGGREYSLMAGVTHKLSDRLVVEGKLGYFDSRNDTTGGFTNFHGPLAYVSMTRAF